MNKPNDQPAEKYDSMLGLLARLYWMLFGNMTLFILTIVLLMNHGKMFNAADVAFGIIVASLVLTRYMDIKLLGGFTVTDKPASMADWRKYTTFLLIGSAALWGLSHAINYLFINK
ncbi:MAG: hypothetical protein WC454_03820 [Phycisphaerae bacterium]|jgi:hypothetical protein